MLTYYIFFGNKKRAKRNSEKAISVRITPLIMDGIYDHETERSDRQVFRLVHSRRTSYSRYRKCSNIQEQKTENGYCYSIEGFRLGIEVSYSDLMSIDCSRVNSIYEGNNGKVFLIFEVSRSWLDKYVAGGADEAIQWLVGKRLGTGIYDAVSQDDPPPELKGYKAEIRLGLYNDIFEKPPILLTNRRLTSSDSEHLILRQESRFIDLQDEKLQTIVDFFNKELATKNIYEFSTRELSKTLGKSQTTVVRYLKLFYKEGWLIRQPPFTAKSNHIVRSFKI